MLPLLSRRYPGQDHRGDRGEVNGALLNREGRERARDPARHPPRLPRGLLQRRSCFDLIDGATQEFCRSRILWPVWVGGNEGPQLGELVVEDSGDLEGLRRLDGHPASLSPGGQQEKSLSTSTSSSPPPPRRKHGPRARRRSISIATQRSCRRRSRPRAPGLASFLGGRRSRPPWPAALSASSVTVKASFFACGFRMAPTGRSAASDPRIAAPWPAVGNRDVALRGTVSMPCLAER